MKTITREQYELIRQDLAGDFSIPCPLYEDLPDAKINYMYSSIEDFEKYTGYDVNQDFIDGWKMARTLINE